MTYNRFSGDPYVKITPDGATMKFIGGNPVMDQGIENAVNISLFTKKNWWGNILFTTEAQKIGSDFEITTQKPVIALQTINDFTDAANKALKWMSDTKLARKINVVVTSPRSDFVSVNIGIEPPGKDKQELSFTKNGSNWISQAESPAHERF